MGMDGRFGQATQLLSHTQHSHRWGSRRKWTKSTTKWKKNAIYFTCHTHTSSFVHLLNFWSLSFSFRRPMECAPSGMSSSLWILFIRPFLWFFISIFSHMLELDQSISYSLNSCATYECDRMAWPCHDEFNFFFVSLLCASHLFPFFEWQTISQNWPNPSGWSSTYFYSS